MCCGAPSELSGGTTVDRDAETKHFQEVCHAIASYEESAELEITRLQRNLSKLTDAERGLLRLSQEEKVSKLRAAVKANQAFLNFIISQDFEIAEEDDENRRPRGYRPNRDEQTDEVSFAREKNHRAFSTEPIEPSCAIEDTEVSSMNVFKVRSTLKQFAREWSEERAEERNTAFKPLIRALKKYVPLEEFRREHGCRPWVLCPGSGLGRLPFDVVCEGYSCQGNEFSYFMLLGSDFMLNHALEPKSFAIQPFCFNTSNRRGAEDHLQTIMIPDVSVAEVTVEGLDFTMCAGDFLEVYADQTAEWDCILTCFFIDTAKNVIQYVHVIANALKPGALWSNFGPLLYHFAESPTEMSIELAWDELRAIITLYFDIVEEEWIDSFYSTSPQSMLQALYHCVHFSALRNNKTVPPELLP